ncbi:MAG: TetR family transcriptional regulator [Deltaproteobacteria bacterium]|nr:MAG: TetR family transcriptional regulator [Deltaproteobacteria bacterium]
MGRPSMREKRRREILDAFARVLASRGYAGATVAAVATEAGIAPGLIHHYFESKAELLSSLLRELLVRFRSRVAHYEEREGDALRAYVDGALKLDARADRLAARCWVGILAEAVRDPAFFAQIRRLLDTEIQSIIRRSGNALSDREASGVLAFVIGSLVLGAFAPRKTAGFAAPILLRMVAAMREHGPP